jgi:hypothetical protein
MGTGGPLPGDQGAEREADRSAPLVPKLRLRAAILPLLQTSSLSFSTGTTLPSSLYSDTKRRVQCE